MTEKEKKSPRVKTAVELASEGRSAWWEVSHTDRIIRTKEEIEAAEIREQKEARGVIARAIKRKKLPEKRLSDPFDMSALPPKAPSPGLGFRHAVAPVVCAVSSVAGVATLADKLVYTEGNVVQALMQGPGLLLGAAVVAAAMTAYDVVRQSRK